MWDVAIAGAGMAGLSCAAKLKAAGLRVVVLEKSRGIGGRVATRRLQNACVDHGLPVFDSDFLELAQTFGIPRASALQILQPWPRDKVFQAHQLGTSGSWEITALPPDMQSGWVAAAGVTAIAKQLAAHLPIEREFRVHQLRVMNAGSQTYWQLLPATTSGGSPAITAQIVVLAIPAPQALALYTPLISQGFPANIQRQLEQVTFEPRLSAIASYAADTEADPLPWQELHYRDHPVLQRTLNEAAKGRSPQGPLLVLHSTDDFAAQFLETDDLMPAGQIMVESAAAVGPQWLNQPCQLQVHRWRYGIASGSYPGTGIFAQGKAPLWLCGDWCTGHKLADAVQAGQRTATEILTLLQNITPGQQT